MNKNKKRILYFIQLPPPIHGVTTVNKFVYQSELINKNYDKDLIEIKYSNNLKQLNRFNIFKIYFYFRLLFRLTVKLASFKPNYVYFTIVPTGIGFYKDLPFVLIIKLFNVIPIYHLHGKGIERKIENKFIKWIYRKVFNQSVIIHLAKSLLEKEIIPLNLKKSKLIYVENGVPVFQIKNIKTIAKKSINILFLSNLFESKGVFIALEAFAIVSKNQNDVVLHLVGGFGNNAVEQKIKNIIIENNLNIKLHGPLYDNEKVKIFLESDIFIHPTLNDTFPLVILEAMQFGLPVISTIQGAIPEIIENNITGFLVKENDSESLSNKIQYLIEHEEKRKEMGVNGFNKYMKNYTMDIFENKMAEAFNNLL